MRRGQRLLNHRIGSCDTQAVLSIVGEIQRAMKMDDLKKAIEQGEKLLNYLGKFPCQCDHSVGWVCHACGNHEIVKNLLEAVRFTDLNERQGVVLDYYRFLTHPDMDAPLTERYVAERKRFFNELNSEPLGKMDLSISFQDGVAVYGWLKNEQQCIYLQLNIKTIGDYEAMIRLFGLDDSGVAL